MPKPRPARWASLLLGAFLAPAIAANPAKASDRLELRGVMQNGRGQPMAGEPFRLVLGSDATPRQPGAGRMLTTDARGGFSLQAPVTLQHRRIRIDSMFSRHDSQLLEIGFEFDLLGHPALHWIEVDFTSRGPLRGIDTFLRGAGGAFDRPLTFHRDRQAWSIPDDPRNLMLTSPGTDLRIDDWHSEGAGNWRLEVTVIREQFEMR